MLSLKYKSFLFLLLVPYILLAQINKSSLFDIKQLKAYSKVEKVYLHTDRDYYSAGGNIFFTAYLMDEALQQSTVESKVLYVDLIDSNGNIVASRNIMLENGLGQGDFDLSSPIFKGGQYMLRGHTAFMRNFDSAFFFRKSIYIQGVNTPKSNTNREQQLQLQFFPEGGDLVIGLNSKIAIKAQDNNGLGHAVKGEIITNKGEKMLEFSTDSYGYGIFELAPKSEVEYFGIITTDKGKKIKQKLPQAQAVGMVMSCKSESEKINLNLAASNNTMLAGGHLIAHARGTLIQEKLLTKGENIQFEIATSDLPTGIIHFTLFDYNGQAQAERLFFNFYNFDNFNIDFSTEEKKYGKREKVQLILDLYDDEAGTLPSNLSLSVTDHYLSNSITSNFDIRSYLLLGADIKGFIKKPARFFEDTDQSKQAMDLLMMTNGWRRFKWKDIIQNKEIERPYKTESSLSITGRITEAGNPNKTVKAKGYLSKLSTDFSMIPFETNADGSFYINQIHTIDSVEMFIQAVKLNKKTKGKKRGKKDKNRIKLKGDKNIDIFIDEKLIFSDKKNDSLFIDRVELNMEMLKNLEKIENINYATSIWGNELNIDLEEVVVKEKRIDEFIAYYKDAMLYTRPNTRILTSSIPSLNFYTDIYDILKGRVAGIQFATPTDGLAKHDVILRGFQTGLSISAGSNAAKFMVNGSLASTSYVESINPQDIAFIDVISSLSQLSLYGGTGSNGLIMIYLKTPQERLKNKNLINKGILNFIHTGYHTAREFYAPNYEYSSTTPKDLDHRVTLHWEPFVKVNEKGEAYIEFFTADRSTIYDIEVQGISHSGIPIIAKSKFMVE
jgi:hypothetical protein